MNKPLGIKVEIDLCEVLGGRANTEFAQRNFHLFHSDSNFQQGCPYTVYQRILFIYILSLQKTYTAVFIREKLTLTYHIYPSMRQVDSGA